MAKKAETTETTEVNNHDNHLIKGMYLETSVEVTDFSEKKKVFEKTGGLEGLTPDLEPISPEEFAKSVFFRADSWKYHEIKFLLVEEGVLNSCHVFHYPDGNGVVMTTVYDEEKDCSVPKYFAFYLCHHVYPGCEAGQCEIHDTCRLCGYTK